MATVNLVHKLGLYIKACAKQAKAFLQKYSNPAPEPKPRHATESPMTSRVFVTAAAVPGNSHICDAGLPCQDAARSWHDQDIVILALSDGHGGKEYARADVGSRIAVDVSIDCLRKVVEGWRLDSGHFDAARRNRALEEMARRYVRSHIVLEWYRRLRLHDNMMRRISGESPEEADVPGWFPNARLYGATLLVAAVFDGLVLALQLGDGEILWVDVNGRGHRVFAPAEKEFGSNATESLASPRAAEAMTVSCQELPNLRFMLLCSDGVADPYIPANAKARVENREEELHAQWGSKFFRILSNDADVTSAGIRWHRWAATLTRRLVSIGGTSNDDVSIAAAWWPDGPMRRPKSPQPQCSSEQMREQ